jgi:LacI family transcriptional regulator
MKVISENQYSPRFVSKSKRNIGIIIDKFELISNDTYFSDLIASICKKLSSNNYICVLVPIEETSIIHKSYLSGIITTTVTNIEDILEPFTKKIPIISINQIYGNLNCTTVKANDSQGTYMAIEHLIQKNHKIIGYLSVEVVNTSAQNRIEGYKQALNDNGIKFDPDLIKEMKNIQLFDALNDLINKNVTAIFLSNQGHVIPALKIFDIMKVNIPNDISLIGYENTKVSEHLIPSMTNIRQPVFEIGQIAAEKMINILENQNESNGPIILENTLITRQSVRTL